MGLIRNAYVDLGEGQAHCRIRDGAGPAVVFLHQTASSSASYAPLLQALRLPNRLIALDTPGFGASFDPEGEPVMRDYAQWMLEALDGLGVETFCAFGHHTGANLALEMADLRPDRALGVMLCGLPVMTAAERARFLETHGSIPLRRDGSHLQVNWDYAANYNPQCEVELLHAETVAMLRAWKGRGQAYRAVGLHDLEPIAARLAAPVLLLTSPDDYFHPELHRARALFPAAEVAETGGGNFQPAADPQGVARAVERFLGAHLAPQNPDQ